DGTDVDVVARAVAGYLTDGARARAAGERGRRWVEDRWRWDVLAVRLAALLGDEPGLDDDPPHPGGQT
ncbi:MAG: hypothetical protein ACRDTP_10260, partial [Mycobacteriales bacterium]